MSEAITPTRVLTEEQIAALPVFDMNGLDSLDGLYELLEKHCIHDVLFSNTKYFIARIEERVRNRLDMTMSIGFSEGTVMLPSETVSHGVMHPAMFVKLVAQEVETTITTLVLVLSLDSKTIIQSGPIDEGLLERSVVTEDFKNMN